MNRRFDPWPAVADLSFVLFVCLLAVAHERGVKAGRTEEVEARLAIERAKREQAEADRDKAEAELRRLHALADEAKRCGGAERFLDKVAQCEGLQVQSESNCSVSFGEGAVRFVSNSSEPQGGYRDNAEALAKCLWRAAWDHRAELEGIDGLYIDGHTDCEGDEERNMALGAERSAWVYDWVVAEARTEDASPAEVRKVLDRFRIRSFGPHEPTASSECQGRVPFSGGVDVPADRRVTISIATKPVAL